MILRKDSKGLSLHNTFEEISPSFSYKYANAQDQIKEEALAKWKATKRVEFSKNDHYVKIGGVVFNGLSKADFEELIEERSETNEE